MIINKCLTPYNKWDGRRGDTVEWIVLHYTANQNMPDRAKNEATYAASAYHGSSAHFFVDEREVWQSVAIEDTAWHCGDAPSRNGCRNTNSIGIEMCNSYKEGVYTIPKKTVDLTVELVLELLKIYPDAQLCRHYDVTGKVCPAPWVEDPRLWDNFLRRIEEGEPMTASEKKAFDELDAQVQVVDERTAEKYNTIDECPDWLRPTVEKLVVKGLLKGEGKGKLALTQDMARILVINDRAGVYGE